MQIELTMAEAEHLMRLMDAAIEKAGPGARIREAIAAAPIAAKLFAAVQNEQQAAKDQAEAD